MRKRIWVFIGALSWATCVSLTFCSFLYYKESLQEVENSNWTADGEWIVFSCYPPEVSARGSLYLVRPDGSEIIRLTTGRHSANTPSWSPDGKQIVFESGGKLFKLKLGAKSFIPLSITDQPDRLAALPVWSPDGTWIAFISRPTFEPGTAALYLVNPDGKVQVPLINDMPFGPITWSSEGQWIIYETQPREFRKVRTDGSENQAYVETEQEEMPLAELPFGSGYPIWSTDREWIIFVNTATNGQLYRVKVDGSETQQITDLDCAIANPVWIKIPQN